MFVSNTQNECTQLLSLYIILSLVPLKEILCNFRQSGEPGANLERRGQRESVGSSV